MNNDLTRTGLCIDGVDIAPRRHQEVDQTFVQMRVGLVGGGTGQIMQPRHAIGEGAGRKKEEEG